MKMLPPSFGPLAKAFGNEPSDDRLSTGIRASYPILRIKGKVWSITRAGSDPHVLMRADGDGPRNSIEVVMLASSQYVSKVWYEQGYEEGSTNPPDCFSRNGVVPDASSSKKQNNACAPCIQNKLGSKITPAGKKAKACADSKRVAVAPLGDIRNEAFGGPMLLRVPAASLAESGQYGDGMKARGYDYWTIGTRLSFDPGEAYPKLVFEPVRPLNEQEAVAVLELRESAAVKAILAEDADFMEEAIVEATIKLPPSFPERVENPITSEVTQPAATRAAPPPPPAPASKATPLPPAPSPVPPPPQNDAFGGSEPVTTASPREAPKVARNATAKTTEPPPPPAASRPAVGEAAGATAVATPVAVMAAGDFEAALDDQLEGLLPEA